MGSWVRAPDESQKRWQSNGCAAFCFGVFLVISLAECLRRSLAGPEVRLSLDAFGQLPPPSGRAPDESQKIPAGSLGSPAGSR